MQAKLAPAFTALRRVDPEERRTFVLLSLGLLAVGFLLRIRQYAEGRALWLDEAMLALNVIRRSFAGLARPLDYNQGAPLGFLWVQKVVTLALGPGEYALRLLPLLASLAALVLFWAVARRYLSHTVTLLALTFAVFANELIYYAAEGKQYAVDVLVGLICVRIFLTLLKRPLGWLSALGYGLAGALLMWFSHPAVFFLGAAGLILAYDALRRREERRLAPLAVTGALWVAGLAALYVVSIKPLSDNAFLLDYWRDSFAPPVTNVPAFARWAIHEVLKSFAYPGGFGLTSAALAALVYAVGVVALYRREPLKTLGLVGPIALALLAAVVGRYPYRERLILFVVPLFAIPIAEGIALLGGILARAGLRFAGPVLALMLLYSPVLDAAHFLLRPYHREEIVPAVEYVLEQRAEDDLLYLYHAAQPAFHYYEEVRGWPGDYRPSVAAIYDWEGYFGDLETLREHERVWIIFSHVFGDEERLFLNYLNHLGGVERDRFQSVGASVYLYEF